MVEFEVEVEIGVAHSGGGPKVGVGARRVQTRMAPVAPAQKFGSVPPAPTSAPQLRQRAKVDPAIASERLHCNEVCPCDEFGIYGHGSLRVTESKRTQFCILLRALDHNITDTPPITPKNTTGVDWLLSKQELRMSVHRLEHMVLVQRAPMCDCVLSPT